MIDWIKRKARAENGRLTRIFAPDGVVIVRDQLTLSQDVTQTAISLVGGEVDAFLHQLESDGYTQPQPGGYLIPWNAIYDLLGHPDCAPSLSLLKIPDVSTYLPALESHNSLTDQAFSISIASWHDGEGRQTSPTPRLIGALILHDETVELLPYSVWQLVRSVSAFWMREESMRNAEVHRRAWGEIRRFALTANARLDDFLLRTVVLTPERLTIGLTKSDVGGTKVIEVVPSFAGAPEDWLKTFDKFNEIPNRYDIPTSDGIFQVLIIPEVKTVLQQIKRMPGRRVAGSRAEAFITNPFAALGEDAGHVIDPDQFELAREDAGLLFERFTAHVTRDAMSYPIEVGLLIEQTNPRGPSVSELRLFSNDEELDAFIRLVRERLAEEMQLCAWNGFDFELLGDTALQVEILEKAVTDRRKPRTLVTYANIYDLTRYAERVEQIGIDKPYYSPFIAKKVDDEGWFPENVVPIIACTPDGNTEPIAVPLTEELADQIKDKIAEAKATERDEITLTGFEKPLPVKAAEGILEAFGNALGDVEKGIFDPTLKEPDTVSRHRRPGLVIRANIHNIDYEEARRDILKVLQAEPKLPTALKPEVQLRDHQRCGIAWLQHLLDKAPNYCRGAVLADDMGLGKTLQLLTLIVAAVRNVSMTLEHLVS